MLPVLQGEALLSRKRQVPSNVCSNRGLKRKTGLEGFVRGEILPKYWRAIKIDS